MSDVLTEIAATLDKDPVAIPHVRGVSFSVHHATLLIELSAALGRCDDEILTEALEAGLETMYRMLVHQAAPHY